MTTLLEAVSSPASPEIARDPTLSTPTPEYLPWLLSPVIKQAIDKMFDTPRFAPGNHKRHR